MNLLHSGRAGAIAAALGAAILLGLAAPAAAADPSRPISGHDVGNIPIEYLNPLAPAHGCPVGSMFYVQGPSAGNLAHLGRVTGTYTHCASGDWNTGAGWTTAPGSLKIVAANGDQLTLSYDMQFQIDMPSMATATGTVDWVVSDGTGRFAHATGKGENAVYVVYNSTLTAGVLYTDWTGTIAY